MSNAKGGDFFIISGLVEWTNSHAGIGIILMTTELNN